MGDFKPLMQPEVMGGRVSVPIVAKGGVNRVLLCRIPGMPLP